MLDDFHETTRNVGVVGVFLALFVVAGLCGLGMAVLSASNGPKEATLEGLVNDQTIQLEALNNGLAERQSELKQFKEYRETLKKVNSVNEEIAEGEAKIDELKTGTETAKELLDAEIGEFKSYRNRYRRAERNAAKGEYIDLSATKGEDFKKVKITGIDALYLRVLTGSGSLGIPFQELPLDVQDRFQFDVEEALEHKKTIRENEAAQAAQMAQWRQKQAGKQAKQALADLEKEIVKTMEEARLKRNQSDILAADAKKWDKQATDLLRRAQNGNRGLTASQARKAREKSDRYELQSAAAEHESERLELLAEQLQQSLKEQKSAAAEKE